MPAMNMSLHFNRDEWNKKILKIWSESNLSVNHGSKKYSMVLPPPNVTGKLHVGHALCFFMQDVFARYHRNHGRDVVWIPGTDHAGIATQSVVENNLRSESVNTSVLAKDELIKRIWEWKELREKGIINQIKSIGASCNWDRYRFTMDKDYSRSVNEAFKILYDKGLIYKGSYLINWDPVCKTALSDDELEYEEVDSLIFYINYKISGSEDNIKIATTRPETMWGDVAIAVHPDDDRYKHLIGMHAINPLSLNKCTIIGDYSVIKDYGTGAVKITPAHDKLDYEIGSRHDLDCITVIDIEGKMNSKCGEFFAMSFIEARDHIVKKLKDNGSLVSTEKIKSRVAISYRSKSPVDTVISEQWFMSVSSFKSDLIDAVSDCGDLEISPSSLSGTYFNWVKNLKDWCISRQIVWGHRIPVWTNLKTGEVKCFNGTQEEFCNSIENSHEWIQETDVLDTWFSSALWPFATLCWPNENADLEKYYPLDILVTGHDIIFFWVTRMLIMGIALTGKIPFKSVVLHGLLFSKSYWKINNGRAKYIFGKEREEIESANKLPKDVFSKWEKVSKSKGNVIDPIDVSSKYGEDAVRIGMLSSSCLLPQVDVSTSRFEHGKCFVNKLWNVAKFILMNSNSIEVNEISSNVNAIKYDDASIWIFNRYRETQSRISNFIESKDVGKAFYELETFFWKDFCSVYIECAKKDKKSVRFIVASTICFGLLIDIHPWAPFITEAIYSIFKNMDVIKSAVSSLNGIFIKSENVIEDSNCITSQSIQVLSLASKEFKSRIERFARVLEIAQAIRSTKGSINMNVFDRVSIFVEGKELELNWLLDNRSNIDAIALIDKINIIEEIPSDSLGVNIAGGLKIAIEISKDMINKEKERLSKQILITNKNIEIFKRRLNSPGFIEKASAEKVKMDKENLKGEIAKLNDLEKSLREISQSRV